MKKILFASTALVATAGVAAADVEFSGSAGMGFGFVDGRVIETDNDDGSTTIVDAADWEVISFATLSVAMTGETDGGLSFGADFDITAGEDTIDNEIVYIEGGFGKLSVGDVDNAVQIVTGLSDIGFDGLGTDNVAEGLRGDSNANILYEGTFGDFAAALSYQMGGTADGDWAIGGKYSMGDYSLGLAYDEAGGVNAIHVQAGADVGDVSLAALYSTTTGTVVTDRTDWGITAAYTMNAVTVTAAYSKSEATTAGVTTSVDGYGLGVSYDLGGGASLDAGVAEINDITVADLGINMSF